LIGSLFTSAVLLGGMHLSPGSALAQSAGQAASTLDHASTLLEDGRVYETKELLRALLRDDATSLTERELQRGYGLLATANKAIRSAPPGQIAQERAELALRDGNLAEAEKQAHAAGDTEAAAEVLAQVSAQRAAIEINMTGLIAAMLDSSVEGDMIGARSALRTIEQSGVALNETDQAVVARFQGRIADLESRFGDDLSGMDSASLGMMQAGTIKPREEQANQPASDTPPAVEPIEDLPDTDQADLTKQSRQFEAQSLLTDANTEFTSGRYNTARDMYNRLLGLYRPYLSESEVTAAERNLAQSQAMLSADISGKGPLDTELTIREIAKQQSIAEFNNLIANSRSSLSQGDIRIASELQARASSKIIGSRDLMSQSEYELYLSQSQALSTEIAQRQESIIIGEAEQTAKSLQEEARQQQHDRERRLQKDIDEKLRRIRSLQAEQKYEEALQVIEEILFLSPNSPAGLLLKEIITDQRLYVIYRDVDVERKQSYSRQIVDNNVAMIAPHRVMDYPQDWPQISYLRGEPLTAAEPAENRRVLAVLDQKRIPVTFQDNTLREVVGFIETVAQLNIDVDWDSLEEISIDPETPISLTLSNVPLRTVLDRVVGKVSDGGFGGDRADWAVIDGILTIASDEQIRRNTTLHIYDLRDLVVEIPNFDEAPTLDLNSVLQGSQGGGGGQSPFTNVDTVDMERIPLEERLEVIIDIVVQNIDPDGWQDNGGSTGTIQQLNGMLIITNTPKNHRAIQGLLSKLREVRAMQINVETRFLLVSQDFFEEIGFDFDVYFNAGNNQVNSALAQDPTILASDFFNFNQGQVQPGGSTGLNRFVTGAANPLGAANGVAGSRLSQGVVNPTQWSPIGVENNSLGLTESLAPTSGIATTILNSAPALGIAGQFLDDIQVDFLVKATQADRRTVQLNAPRLTVTNGQISNIWVATQVSFVSDLSPVVSDSAVGFDPTVSVVSEGVVMLVEGTISADRRYVTMTIDAAVSEIEGFEQQAVSAVAGGQLVSSADTQSFVQLPIVTVTRVQTTVTVPDQGTVLLGGQRLVGESEVETGVPVLSKLPILNRFFSNRLDVKEEATLLILLKPTIMIQNEEEERNFPGLMDRLQSGLAQ